MNKPGNQRAADALAAMSGQEALRQADEAAGQPGDSNAAAPTVDPRVLGRTHHAPVKSPRHRSIETKRTFIPILLTLGVLMPAMASLKWIMPPDSPYAAWPTWPTVLLALLGTFLLAVAILNMLHVRHLLRHAN